MVKHVSKYICCTDVGEFPFMLITIILCLLRLWMIYGQRALQHNVAVFIQLCIWNVFPMAMSTHLCVNKMGCRHQLILLPTWKRYKKGIQQKSASTAEDHDRNVVSMCLILICYVLINGWLRVWFLILVCVIGQSKWPLCALMNAINVVLTAAPNASSFCPADYWFAI